MQEDNHTVVFTTVSAIAGGLSKLIITKPFLLYVTINGLLLVMTYAAASAVVGYIVKRFLDFIFQLIINYFFKTKEGDHE